MSTDTHKGHDVLDDSALKLQLKGTWNELVGTVKETWGELTDDDLKVGEGNFQELFGRIQKKSGETLEGIHAKLDRFFS